MYVRLKKRKKETGSDSGPVFTSCEVVFTYSPHTEVLTKTEKTCVF